MWMLLMYLMWNMKGHPSTEQKKASRIGSYQGRNPTDKSRNTVERQNEAHISLKDLQSQKHSPYLLPVLPWKKNIPGNDQ